MNAGLAGNFSRTFPYHLALFIKFRVLTCLESAICFEDGIRRVGFNHVSWKIMRPFQLNVLVMSKNSALFDIAISQPVTSLLLLFSHAATEEPRST